MSTMTNLHYDQGGLCSSKSLYWQTRRAGQIIELMHAREAQTADVLSLSPATANIGPLMCAILLLLVVPCIIFLVKLYYFRQQFRSLRRPGLPILPDHQLLGHIPLAASIVRSLPKYAADTYNIPRGSSTTSTPECR